MCTSSVSNVIYHKFSHGAPFYKLNWKNVNVMLEWDVKPGPEVIKHFFMLNSTEHDVFPAHKC